MEMLLHSNEHLQISTVADRLSMFKTCERNPLKAPILTPSPGKFDAKVVKRTGKRAWRPKRVVLVVEGGGGISEGVVGVDVVAGLKVVVPQSSSFNV
jgi:hypothetical protein